MRNNKKKVFETIATTISPDGETTVNRNALYVSRSSESFGMFTTTDGIDWAVPLRGCLLLLMYMTMISDPKTGYVSLSTLQRRRIVDFFGWSNPRSLGFMIAEAIRYNGMCRIGNSKNDFMINPEYFFSGSTNDKINKINEYRRIKHEPHQ